MKQLSFGMIMLLTLCLLNACKSNGKNNKISNTDTITSADSLNAMRHTAPKNIAPDPNDAHFLAETASAALAEIELGKMARQRGENKRVKNFGILMMKDLVKANNKIIALAQSKKITIPTAPYAYDQKTVDSLGKISGKTFDEAYVNNMIAGHQKYIKIFESESQNSSDPDIKKFANKTLRALKNHLDAINTIKSSM